MKWWWLPVAAGVLGVRPLPAQETTGAVRGRLVAGATGPVAGALVVASGPAMLGDRRAASASDGVFTLQALPPGIYSIRVASIGFRPTLIQSVAVKLGRVTGLGDIHLERSAVELSEVTVTAPPLTLDPVRTTVGGILEPRDYAALPSERDYRSLITLIPHINASYHGDPANSGGSTGLENMYFIDGANVTSPLNGATGTSLPYNFVRSVEVRAGGYEAQYGRALGAIVNAVTYTGTDQFEANAFGFFTHDALRSAPKAAPVVRELDSYSLDAGARASGPILRRRLWFSAAYNPRVDHSDRGLASLGTFVERRTAHVFAGKLTWQPLPTSSIELGFFGDPTVHEQVSVTDFLIDFEPVNPEIYLPRVETGGTTALLRTTTSLGTRWLLNTTLTRTTNRDHLLARTELGATSPAIQDNVTGTIAGGVPYLQRNAQERLALALHLTRLAGRHTLAGGFEYERNRNDYHFENPAMGFIVKDSESQYLLIDQAVDATLRHRTPSIFLQNTWRATDRLTLNAGVRWSRQSLIGNSGATAQRFGDEWQPRLGASLDLDRHRRHRAFASYGRFYQQEPLYLASLFYVDYGYSASTYATDPRTPGAVPTTVDQGIDPETHWARDLPRIATEHLDEVTAGYEALLGSATTLTVRGIRRQLHSGFIFAVDSLGGWHLGTPGRGELAFLPSTARSYSALELDLVGRRGHLDFRASYVLSRTYGNYPGLFSSDVGVGNPGQQFGYMDWYQARNSTGLLPNDRPHVLKVIASYEAGGGLQGGATLFVMSGTPLTELGAPLRSGGGPLFLSPRGSAGRTPAVWDLSFRASYLRESLLGTSTRFILDLLHAGNPQRAVRRDQTHFRSVDGEGNQFNANPNYLFPIAYQPPMTARLGVEVGF